MRNLGCLLLIVVIGGAWVVSQSPSRLTPVSAAGTAAGPIVTPTPTPHIGTYLELNGWRISLRQSDLSDHVSITENGLTSRYPASGIFVTLLVELTNLTARGDATLGYGDFALLDSKGVTYAPARIFRLYARDGYGELGHAFTRTVPLLTELYFDVAPGTTGMVLVVGPPGKSAPVGIGVE